MKTLDDSVVLITGGTGSWAKELTKLLITTNVKKIIILAHGEVNLVDMSRTFIDKRISYVYADVRDKEALLHHFRGVDYVFHLAALKHVPVCEDYPIEAIRTNVEGTMNVVNAAIERNVKRVVYVSTDKAVDPVNTYGLTKTLGEKIVIQANQYSNFTKFVVIRGGNVLGTNGSVVPFFRELIERNNKITLTNKDMTRFFITVQQAIKLLVDALDYSVGGEIFVIKMRSFTMEDVAQAIIDEYGNPDTKIEVIGLRPGEKLHELLISRNESTNAYHYNDDYFVILPMIKIGDIHKIYADLNLQKFTDDEYCSANLISTIDDLKVMMRSLP